MVEHGARGTTGGRVVLTGVLVVLLMVAAACGSSKASTAADGRSSNVDAEGTPVGGGSLVVGVTAETPGWNPHYSAPSQSAAFVASSVLEPLATIGENSEAEPFLATSWTPNATFDHWEVALRDDVTFQDGSAFDAQAVKLNVEDAISGPVSGPAIPGVFKGVSVVDPHTVAFDLNQPWAAFPSSFLISPMTLMMAPSALAGADHGDKHPVGTGPFVFDNWTPGTSFKAKKNPTYWQAGQPHLDQIEFEVIPDNVSRAAALQSGDIDMMLTTSNTDATQLESSYQVIKDWNTEPGMIITNTGETIDGKSNPLHNIHARRALAYATDRKTIASTVGAGLESPSSPFAPDNPWGMPEDQNGYPGFDVEQAKAEVAAYEADTGETSLHVTLLSIPDVDATTVTQLVQSQWKEAGIDVDLESVEGSAIIGRLITGKYEAATISIYSAPDPDQNKYFWSADNISGYGGININLAQYSSPQIEADLKVGHESGDTAARKAAYDDLVRQLNAAAVNIWTYWTPYSIIADHSVHGLHAAETIAFANYQPKTWFGQLWHS